MRRCLYGDCLDFCRRSLPRHVSHHRHNLYYAPLGHRLHRLNIVDSPLCQRCGSQDETVEHFLLHCPAHAEQRQELWDNVGGPLPLCALLSKPENAIAIATFIASTRRFESSALDISTTRPTSTLTTQSSTAPLVRRRVHVSLFYILHR